MKSCPLDCLSIKTIILLLLTGLLAVIFYALHIIIGSLYYPGYNHLTQAISDLTGKGAPSQAIATLYSTLYGIFIIVFAFSVFLVFKNDSKLKKIASIIFFFAMIVSFVGYGLFPLNAELPSSSFSNIMHIIVTILVVILTIIMFILFGISFISDKKMILFGYFTFLCLFLMFMGSLLMGIGPSGFFGVYERMNIYAIQLWFFVLAITLFIQKKPILHQQTNKN